MKEIRAEMSERPIPAEGGGGGGPSKEGDEGTARPPWAKLRRNKRRIVVVGGFDRDTPGEILVEKLKTLTVSYKDTLEEIQSFGKLASVGKLIFKNSDGMWQFLKSMKGKRLEEDLWHSIISTKEERIIAKQGTEGSGEWRLGQRFGVCQTREHQGDEDLR